MPRPQRRPERHRRETLLPLRAPAFADEGGIGGARLIDQHDAAPPEIVVDDAAAHVVHVVGIAVVGRAHGEDRLERRRAQRRDLQRVEAAPRLAHEPDRAGAPALPRDPGDDLAVPSASSCAVYSSSSRPSDSPEPRDRRAAPHSRAPRNNGASARRARACRRACGRGCIRGSPEPAPPRRPRAARAARRGACRRRG